jgi:hypothetical protein
VISSVVLDLGALPLIAIPPALKPADLPAPLPVADAASLVLINPLSAGAAAGPLAPRAPGTTSRRIEGAVARPTSITLSNNENSFDHASVLCAATGSTSVVQPLRWETFSIGPTGGALWAIHDGWFDPNDCRLAEARVLVIQPRVLALLGGQPVVFAVRTTEGLVLLYPAVDSVLGDAMAGAVHLGQGPITRLILPLAKGSSATVISTHTLSRMATWLAAAEGKTAGDVGLGNGSLTLRIEVTQTVSEESPTLLLQLRSEPLG